MPGRGRATRADEHEADDRKRLTEAWTIPVFSLQASADMTRANALVAAGEAEQHVTVTDVLVKVCAAALMEHREVNAEWTEDAILLHPNANVGIAVAAPQGLIVRVIRGAERLRLAEISAARAESSDAPAMRSSPGKTSKGDVHDLEPRDV